MSCSYQAHRWGTLMASCGSVSFPVASFSNQRTRCLCLQVFGVAAVLLWSTCIRSLLNASGQFVSAPTAAERPVIWDRWQHHRHRCPASCTLAVGKGEDMTAPPCLGFLCSSSQARKGPSWCIGWCMCVDSKTAMLPRHGTSTACTSSLWLHEVAHDRCRDSSCGSGTLYRQ